MQKIAGIKNNSVVQNRPHIFIIHHYMWPDESPTSRLFSDLAFFLSQLGCHVSVFSTQERYILQLANLSKEESFKGVRFLRARGGTGFRKGAAARLLAGFFLLFKWLLLSLRTSSAELVIVGTDPPFSVWLGALLKKIRKTKSLILWSMDVYPDAIIADGLAGENDFRTRFARLLNKWALSHCDGIVDLGVCMRRRITVDKEPFVRETISPWAPYEAESHLRDKETNRLRSELFDQAKIGLIYSGTLGCAHDLSLFIRLSLELRELSDSVSTVISSHGPNFVKLKSHILSQKIPIKCLNYEPGENYVSRLKAADFHLVSVKKEWTGIVVPSKFFASLAVGRPVIAAVDNASCLAMICQKYDIGWVLNGDNLAKVKEGLKHMLAHPDRLLSWQKHVIEIYRKHFSRNVGLRKWANLLR